MYQGHLKHSLINFKFLSFSSAFTYIEKELQDKCKNGMLMYETWDVWLGWGPCEISPSTYACPLVRSLGRSCSCNHILRVYGHNIPVMSRGHSYSCHLNLLAFNVFIFLQCCSLSPVCWTYIVDVQLFSHLFSAFWPAKDLCSSLHLLQKWSSFGEGDGYIYLWV